MENFSKLWGEIFATNENNCLLEINEEMKTSLAERIGENLDHWQAPQLATFLREGFRWNLYQDNLQRSNYDGLKQLMIEEKMMVLKYLILDNMWIMKRELKLSRMT